MISLLQSSTCAHEDSIWCCTWGRLRAESGDTDDEEDGQEMVITGSIDDTIKIWLLKDDAIYEYKTLIGHSLGVLAVALNSRSTVLASTSLDCTLIVWEMPSGNKMRSVTFGPVEIWTVAFAPGDQHIITGCDDGKINMYTTESGELAKTFDTRGKLTLSIAFSPDGNYVASGAIDGIVNIFDAISAKLTHTLEGHALPIRCLSFSPDSRNILTASDDGHMKVYSVQHAQLVGTLSGHASWVVSVHFAPDGKHFMSCSTAGELKLWQVSDLRCLQTVKAGQDQVWDVKYNHDGTRAIAVTEEATINLYSFNF